jgi:hypothetical protein
MEIARFQEVRSGSLAFQAPASAQALALLFLDTNNGHLLLPIKGPAPRLSSTLGGQSRGNEFVDLAVTGMSWADAKEPGARTLVATIKGISRQNAMVDMPFGEYAFLQTDEGCIAQPDESPDATVSRSLAPVGRFIPFAPNEGQLAFTVPATTRAATLMFRATQGRPIDLPVLGNTPPQRPAARQTVQDGAVLRVSLVGTGTPPAGLPGPPEGRQYLVVDYVVENLQTGQGVELQADPQFSLVDGAGQTYPADAGSSALPCRLTGAGVVPAGGSLNVKYRGFEAEGLLKVR